ncbi:hypothetical protein F2Q70_00017682 [Brassica cretica]|uniref:Uncharacterized protein n=1 Tax=Brassica cretica TaxID=69181 RepID=A0A3N6S7P7_BRACR|nr:hypothetical protein F2Q70_00017682 [Brassica cretica]KAF2596476.1 hypothetical protein F2Q68_00010621 [Brassica cretica]
MPRRVICDHQDCGQIVPKGAKRLRAGVHLGSLMTVNNRGDLSRADLLKGSATVTPGTSNNTRRDCLNRVSRRVSITLALNPSRTMGEWVFTIGIRARVTIS